MKTATGVQSLHRGVPAGWEADAAELSASGSSRSSAPMSVAGQPRQIWANCSPLSPNMNACSLCVWAISGLLARLGHLASLMLDAMNDLRGVGALSTV